MISSFFITFNFVMDIGKRPLDILCVFVLKQRAVPKYRQQRVHNDFFSLNFYKCIVGYSIFSFIIIQSTQNANENEIHYLLNGEQAALRERRQLS